AADRRPLMTGAPWDCDVPSALVWWTRGGRAASGASDIGGRALVVVGAFIAYRGTPVGPYSEVLGAIGVRDGVRLVGTVPFIAVDSAESRAAGRANWALPKEPARFTGDMAAGTAAAAGDGWRIGARATTAGPRIPLPVRGTLVQRWPDGSARAATLTGRARARLAVVQIDVEGPPGA